MRMKALASGSNGNCIYVNGGNTHILIDAGISTKRIREGLLGIGIAPEMISAIFVTHEHSDHISGLFIFSKHYHVPIYGTEGTLKEIADADIRGEIDPSLYHVIRAEEDIHIEDLVVRAMHVYHDAADPVSYRIIHEDKIVSVMTDTGKYTDDMVDELQGLSGLLLESNHDIRMLETGSYPYPLKRRILSDHGHLSNESAAKLLVKLLNPSLKFVLLGHISEENNYPDIAVMTTENELHISGDPAIVENLKISAATRYEPSEMYEV